MPWSAVVRGALAAGPLLLVAALLAGRPSVGVVAALGAMLAGINDRPGSRRAAVSPDRGARPRRWRADCSSGRTSGAHVGPVALIGVLRRCSGSSRGAVSAVGPVASAAGTQLLVAVAIGAGMPLPEPGWQRALFFLAGAGVAARRCGCALPTPGHRR